MKTLKLIDVDKVEAGDVLLFNHVRLIVDYVEKNGFSYDLQMHDWKSTKVRKCLVQGDQVSLEI
jgi:hypothetical protein